MVARHGIHYNNLIPSFGLEQGVDEEGKPKFRRVDAHTAGLTNVAATRAQKIGVAMVDYSIIMIRAMASRFGCGLHIGTEDMKAAYRQILLPDSQTSVSIAAVYSPLTKEAETFELYGQPFGAQRAVPNFYRVAEWMCRLLIRGYSLLVDCFFDELYYVERDMTAGVTQFCLQETSRSTQK